MNKEQAAVLREKIISGIKLAIHRMITQRQKEDEELVISRNGEVIIIKAKELLK